MNYVQTAYIGNNNASRTKKTKTAPCTAQQICPLDAETQRRRPGAERQTKASPHSNASDGFLKTSFLPKLKEAETAQACPRLVQMDFYTSLAQLAQHYKITPMQTTRFEYPYNMALAVWDMEAKLKENVLNCPELRLLQDSKRTYFISEEIYSTGTTLYYIPIEPLYQMMRDPKRRKNVQLLISVCSYLYHIADIPYYRQENSYLYWLYEMHKDWMEQDDEEQEIQRDISDFEKAELIGDCIEKKLFNRRNLEVFQKRLNSFKSRDAFDRECLLTARKAFDLYEQYPTENIFRNAPIKEQDESEDPENQSIGMEKYISFIYDTKGWLYESIAQSINNEFNEYAQMDEPAIFKTFNGSDVNNTSLDFENRLFALLDHICQVLYNYKMTENEYR